MKIIKDVIIPQWPAPSHVYAAMSTRLTSPGVSQAPFNGFNLGDHVHDKPEHVAQNRKSWEACMQALCTSELMAPLSLNMKYLKQVHGIDIVYMEPSITDLYQADACFTDIPLQSCTIMIADCLPVLFCTQDGQIVGAAHAGWRGLLNGVLEVTVAKLEAQHKALATKGLEKIYAWLGPCIGPQAFEVGEEVLDAFLASNLKNVSKINYARFFQKQENGKWRADLAGIAREKLEQNKNILCFGNDSSLTWCTFSNPKLFFSHRRDAVLLGSTGRMAVSIFRG